MPTSVLVVDDDAANRELLGLMLSTDGYSVLYAEDGRSGLQAFANLRPDVVLMDVQMPGMNGLQACVTLKQNPETRLTPVILITALGAIEDRVRGIEAGADDFLIKPVERAQLLARVRSLANLKQFTDELERAESVLFTLARSIEAKDPYTEGHCERTASFCRALGKAIGMSDEEILILQRAGLVHDIGKVAIPDSVLLKPGPLTPEEQMLIRQHPIIGERICSPMKSFRPLLPIIRHHHEKLDGTGYPDGLKGDQIPVPARVLQVMDVFDALTTERPYRRSMSVGEALEVIQDEVRKGWWDADIFVEFCRLIDGSGKRRPMGTKLATAAIAASCSRAAWPTDSAGRAQLVSEISVAPWRLK